MTRHTRPLLEIASLFSLSFFFLFLALFRMLELSNMRYPYSTLTLLSASEAAEIKSMLR